VTLPDHNITVVLSNPDVHYYTFSLALSKQVNSTSFARRQSSTYPVASSGRTVSAAPARTPALQLSSQYATQRTG
jgi:hypothetical protein